MGILANYKKIGKQPPPIDIEMSNEAKYEVALELLDSGDTAGPISKYLGVSRRTVYNWRDKSREDHLMHMCSKTYVELFASDIKWIEDEIARYEQMSQVLYDAIVIVEDDKEGVRVSLGSTGKVRDYNDCRRVVKDLKKMQTEILTAMSLKNKDGDPNIHGTLSDKNIIEHKEQPKLAKDEEILRMMRNLKLEAPKLKNVSE